MNFLVAATGAKKVMIVAITVSASVMKRTKMNSGLIVKTPQSDLWETPPEVFEPLNAEFRFTVDAAASPENTKCGRFWTEDDNGLYQDWSGHTVWVNPPYSKGQILAWTDKAKDSKATVVMLLPVFTDQLWFHLNVNDSAELRFFRGRIRFHLNGKPVGSPRFPSMLAIWRGR